nr:hypothetical protein [Tanacetum cinerariifolium]
MKKRPQTKSEARKNMMIYLKNTASYKLVFFKGMLYDEIYPIFQDRFDANMRFLFKSREEMKEEDQKRLEVVDDEDDDVFTEATPLARKLILLVERKYPLLKFTLEQLVNVTRHQVEEESEMPLELLRFTRK